MECNTGKNILPLRRPRHIITPDTTNGLHGLPSISGSAAAAYLSLPQYRMSAQGGTHMSEWFGV